MKGPIKKADYDNVRAMILSGQIPQEDVPDLLQRNKRFALWYVERQLRPLPPKEQRDA
jgi:hypothetical protein